MSDKRVLIYVEAVNDRNGNPRRGWVVTWMDNLFVDEGYKGRDALYTFVGMPWSDRSKTQERHVFDGSVNEIWMDITVSQYNRLKRGE